MGALWRDLTYALRILKRSPGFTAVAVLTLALGIGANTAIFQLVDAVRLRQLPVKDPQELVDIGFDHKGWFAGSQNGRYTVLSDAIWEQIRDCQQAFSGVAAWGTDYFNLSRGGEARYAQGLWVSGDFFNVLGVRPILGRVFTSADDHKDCGSAGVVISYSFWQSEFGGAPSAVGSTVFLNGHPFDVIGVTPENFYGVEVGRRFDVAAPICSEPLVHGEESLLAVHNGWWLASMGRLKPGWTAERASAHLAAMSPAIFQATLPPMYNEPLAKVYLGWTLRATPAATGLSTLREDYATSLKLLMITSGVVLLIACANLANLLLARANARRREIAVRLALGASRERIIRQLLTESLLLTMAGALAGALLAQWVSEFLVALLSTHGNPLYVDLNGSSHVLAFTILVSALTCVLFGLTPALQATRMESGAVMKDANRTTPGGRSKFSLRRALVVSQVALSLALLMGALLFVRTMNNLFTQDAGFQQGGILAADIDLTALRLPVAERRGFKEALAAKIKLLPGVDAVADQARDGWGDYDNNVLRGDGKDAPIFQADENYVEPGYFDTLKIPLLAGRDFDQRDTPASAKVVIVNELFARKLTKDSSPIGKIVFMRTFADAGDVPYRIVGMVRNTKYQDLRDDFTPIVYFPRAQEHEMDNFAHLYVRSNAPLAGIATAVKSSVAESNPDIGIRLHVFQTDLHESLVRERMMAILSGFFGVVAALLATVGLYGVISYMVVQRTKEIGIRMALGAGCDSILRMILTEAVALLAIGVAIGAGLALAVGKAASALLFGVKPYDPVTLVLAVALLSGVAVLASYLPARRASKVDPIVALRYE